MPENSISQRLENRLQALAEAIESVEKTTDLKTINLFRDAAIQRFEFSIEIAWKCAAKFLGSSSATAKPVIREMAQNKLIENPELCFGFIEARNKTSHTYDEAIAKSVYLVIKQFLPEAEKMLTKLKNK